MDDTKVQTPETFDATLGSIAADLRRIADTFDLDPHVGSGTYIRLNIQPGGTDEQVVARTNAVAALFGVDAGIREMHNGTWHYEMSAHVGAVMVHLYDGITDPKVREREAEMARLRARVAELEAKDAVFYRPQSGDDAAKFSDNGFTRAAAQAVDDETGLDYSRPADGDNPQPSAGRMPAHLEDGTTGDVVMVESHPLVSEETIAEAAAMEECDRAAGGPPWEVTEHPENSQPGGWHHGQLR